MATSSQKTSFVPEQGEQIVGEYETVGVMGKLKGVRDAGILIITSQRVVFYRQEGILKKTHVLANQVPLWAINKISQGGTKTGKTTFRHFIVINGLRYFLLQGDPRVIEQQLKVSSKAAKVAKKTGIPATVAPMQALTPNVTKTPEVKAPALRTAIYCSSCGKGNEPTDQFCGGCGAKLQ